MRKGNFANACRFSSDRTARRHLAELEATGFLGVADTRSTSPLFPRVYFVTGRGVRKIEESLRERGKSGRCCRRDRRRGEAYSADHALHEILTTEFLLNVLQICEHGDDLELLMIQRRALERHRAMVVYEVGRHSRLKPDGIFMCRQNRGLICCFLKVDNGTMSLRQMGRKFRRYGSWAGSAIGQDYLLKLYRDNGAAHPKPVFRVLVVVQNRLRGGDHRRTLALLRHIRGLGAEIRNRF